MALSHDMTQHEMHMAYIKVGSAEMERNGERWVFLKIETTRHAQNLDVSKQHDILLDV